jgi:hypothetical protein
MSLVTVVMNSGKRAECREWKGFCLTSETSTPWTGFHASRASSVKYLPI